jgi:sirohydrochlorin ferrochelatase
LVDHGSRASEANESLATVAALVRERNPGVVVAHAHMELAAPSIADAMATLLRDGATEIVVVPYFLSPGRHSRDDIPRLVADAASAHPGIHVVVSEPLGPHALLAELVALRAGLGPTDG